MTLFKKKKKWQGKKHDSLGSTMQYKIICISKLTFQKKHLAQILTLLHDTRLGQL